MDKVQHEMVLDYLKRHKEGMTSLQAYEMFGIMQMPKRIFNLKKMGWKIKSVPKTGTNRFGRPVKYVQYVLEGPR